MKRQPTTKEADRLLQQYEWANDPQGVLKWAIALQLKNEQGQPLEWRDRRFMVDIMCDMHPNQVLMKCSQVGASTLEFLKAYFLAQVLGRRIVYSLPSDKLVQDFSTTKVEPMEKANPLIVPTATNNKGSKSWAKAGYILLRGTMGESQDVMVTADHIIADEVNHSDIGVVKGLSSRLQASPIKATWWFGHPTFPLIGVDEKWRESDQREWHVKCKSCGLEQPLDFWQNIDRERKIYVCRECNTSISDDDRRMGRWIPTNPGAKWHGYHISHLIAPWITAEDVLEAEKMPKDYFFSKVLGLPFVGGSGAVDPGLIRQSNVWPVPTDISPKQKFIGVDVGGPLHVVIGNEYGITKAMTLADDPNIKPEYRDNFDRTESKWGKLHQLMGLEQPTLLVIDNLPSGKEQAAFQKRHTHKVLRCIYDYNDKRKEDFSQDREQGTINAHRTRVIDTILGTFSNGETKIFMDPNDPYFDGSEKTTSKIENCIVQHWQTLYQVGADGQDVNIVKKDKFGNVIRTWENSGPDHFAHATVYYYLARQAGRHIGTGTGGFMPGSPGPKGVRKPEFEDDLEDDDMPKVTFFGM